MQKGENGWGMQLWLLRNSSFFKKKKKVMKKIINIVIYLGVVGLHKDNIYIQFTIISPPYPHPSTKLM